MPRAKVLYKTNFPKRAAGWIYPALDSGLLEFTRRGLLISPAGKKRFCLPGPGIHCYNGNGIEAHFSLPDGASKGSFELSFTCFDEWLGLKLDFARRTAVIDSSDWTRPQPIGRAKFTLSRKKTHVLQLVKTDTPGGGALKNADMTAYLDGKCIIKVTDVNMLGETGAHIAATGARVLLEKFVQRGVDNGIPEYLHVGAWQMLNLPSIEDNLASLYRGLTAAADKGIKLLVTPETSLTGLHRATTLDPKPIAPAERKLRRFISKLPNAPHLIAGMPIWVDRKDHRIAKTNYNVSRVYDPDGGILATCAKIHSCEPYLWHGHKLNEFDVCGVPCSMHICHDGRYPYTWTLPVMFGARLQIRPANGGSVSGTIDAFEKIAASSVGTSHAFRINCSGGGGSYIAGPTGKLLAVSDECSRNVSTFPNVSEPVECLIDANIRVHDALGEWPNESFRVSEEVAQAYIALYKALGGKRLG